MSNIELNELFDQAFIEITKKLIKLDLNKSYDEQELEHLNFLEEGYREVIETQGSMNSTVICHFSETLYRYIITTMNGGTLPDETEIYLYLNEYINIICGYAVSQLNNITGTKSRLSVPRCFGPKEEIDCSLQHISQYRLSYESKYGRMHVFMIYSI